MVEACARSSNVTEGGVPNATFNFDFSNQKSVASTVHEGFSKVREPIKLSGIMPGTSVDGPVGSRRGTSCPVNVALRAVYVQPGADGAAVPEFRDSVVAAHDCLDHPISRP